MNITSDTILVLPILVPLISAICCIFLWKYQNLQRVINMAGSIVLLVATSLLLKTVLHDGIISTQIAGWEAPFGITLVSDLLSAIMLILTAVIGFTVSIYTFTDLDVGASRKAFGYYPLFNILLVGVCGSFLTGDMFNLYVWFEVMLISSFVLMALGGEKNQIEGSIKYVTLNLISSALFLSGVGILYGMTGSLNMAELSVIFRDLDSPGLELTLSMIFLISFGIKSATFPLFFWLPASYHTPPVAISALFAGLLTKVGVYALIRVFTLIFITEISYTHTLILVVAGLTMITGVLGAIAQNEFRRILSFHIISQIGYMIMGLGLFTPLAIAGSIFYIIHHIIVKSNLFLISGVVYFLKGSFDLKSLGGVYQKYPYLSFLFLIPALSLAGVPPLSGFWAKFTLVMAGLEAEEIAIVTVALFVGLLTLVSMTKIWAEVFWKKRDPESGNFDWEPADSLLSLLVPIVMLCSITVLIGIFAEPVFTLSNKASLQLLDPSIYIEAVLGGKK